MKVEKVEQGALAVSVKGQLAEAERTKELRSQRLQRIVELLRMAGNLDMEKTRIEEDQQEDIIDEIDSERLPIIEEERKNAVKELVTLGVKTEREIEDLTEFCLSHGFFDLDDKNFPEDRDVINITPKERRREIGME